MKKPIPVTPRHGTYEMLSGLRCGGPPRTPPEQGRRRTTSDDLNGRLRTRSMDSSSRKAGAPGAQAPFSCSGNSGPRRQSTGAASRPPAYGEDELAEYNGRFISGYEKGRMLGKGACAVVWLAVPSGQKGPPVAVKQVAKGTSGKHRSDAESAKKEILFGNQLFARGGEPKLPAAQFPGVAHIARLLDCCETRRDIWLVMEFGGTCLTKMAYEIKGEFLGGERLYRVNHLPLMQLMKRDASVVKRLFRQLLSALSVLSDLHIVHSDIKPDNILIEEDERRRLRARFIDLGSASTFDPSQGEGSAAMATPEYMPPEALEACAARSSALSGGSLGGFAGGSRASLSRASSVRSTGAAGRAPPPVELPARRAGEPRPWSFDVWSLGAILLELGSGTPLWLSYKCRVADEQRTGVGLFAVAGRDPEKILQRQSEVLLQRGLARVLREPAGIPLDGGGGADGLDFLGKMLVWDHFDRISPHEALDHPWVREPPAHHDIF